MSKSLETGVCFLWYRNSGKAAVLLVMLLFLIGAFILALVAHYMRKK